MTPLERWCARNPSVRWPLVFVAVLLVWGLAGALDAEAAALLTLP